MRDFYQGSRAVEKGTYGFTISSALRASPERVWAHASSWAGVNRELWPLLSMTEPGGHPTLATLPLGRTAFRSWCLLFGLIPIDFDDVLLVEREEGRGFLEESRLFSATLWRHRRTIRPEGAGCLLVDELVFTPRQGFVGPVLAALARVTFENRHRVLRRVFGAQQAVPGQHLTA
jgi:ligand-binding SRPBCC domain-containing protein